MLRIEFGNAKGTPIYIDDTAENMHIACIGTSGIGKTTEAERILLDIVSSGFTVLTFDSHRVFVEDQIFKPFRTAWTTASVVKDAYQDGIGCPLFSCIDQFEDSNRVALALSEVLSSTLNLGCNQSDAIYIACMNVIKNNSYNSLGISALGKALAELSNTDIDESVKKAAKQVLRKLAPLFSPPVFHNAEALLTPKCINIVNVNRFDLSTQNLIVEITLAFIWRLANAGIFEHSPLFIFLDECQNLSGRRTKAIHNLLSEGRKMGVNLILATQKLDKNPLKNEIMLAATKLFFKPVSTEASLIASIIDTFGDMSNRNRWISILTHLQPGEFVLVGKYLYDDISSEDPIVVSAREPDLFEANIDETAPLQPQQFGSTSKIRSDL